MTDTSWSPGTGLVVLGDLAASRLDQHALQTLPREPAPNESPSAFLAVGLASAGLLDAVRAFRAGEHYGYYPLLAERPDDLDASPARAELERLVDAFVEDVNSASDRARAFWGDVTASWDASPETPEERLLAYMLLRGDEPLRPVRDWQTRELYYYPILRCLSGTHGLHLLNALNSRGAIAREQLVERLRLCSHCSGAHLIFVDTCPACHSLELQRDEAIHCFTCGHVGSQRTFLTGGAMTCPNCRTRLRHIGTDYDRPLENHSCGGCGEMFAEPEVLARCAVCDHASATDELVVREIASYRLTDYGRMLALHGDAGDLADIFDQSQYLRLPVFEHLLRWQAQVATRHEECHFSLLLIQLTNLEELADQLGRGRLSMLLYGFAERLQELIRTSDLCTRTREQDFWLLLPQTDTAGSRLFLQRLEELTQASQSLRSAGLEFQAQVLASRDRPDIGDHTGRDLMQRLGGTMADDTGV